MSSEEGDTTPKPALDHEETMETAEMESDISSTQDKQQRQPVEAMPEYSDEEALKRAKDHMEKDQVLVASRLLKNMTTIPEEEAKFQKEVELKATLLEGIIADLLSEPDEAEEDEGETSHGKWLKMGESHDGHRDTVSYYQLTEDLQLKCRLETPIESSLLVPLIAVLIETDLYTNWLPKWAVPRIGLASVEKLAQMGRTEQIVHFISEVPWPFTARDVMLQTCATDDIDDLEGPTTGTIAIGLKSLEGGEAIRRNVVCNEHYMNAPEVLDIAPPQDSLKRAGFDGGLLIRKCPDDHVSLQHSTIEYPSDEHLVLVGFSMKIDGKISPMFPKTIINFVIQVGSVHCILYGYAALGLP